MAEAGEYSLPLLAAACPELGLAAVTADVAVSGVVVEVVLSFRSFVTPLVGRLAPANTVIQQTPTRKSIAPIAFRIEVKYA